MQPTHTFNVTSGLALSLELSSGSWKIAASDGCREKPALHGAEAKAPWERLQQVLQRIEQLKAK